MTESNQQLPKEIEDYIERGKQAYKKHNYGYAVELFNNALKLKQDLPEVLHYLHLSKIKNFKENPPSLIAKGTSKLKAQTYVLNARKLKSDGKSKAALSEYEKALSIAPLNANIYLRLAELLMELNKEEMAVKTLKEVLSFDPENVNALKNLGKIHQEKERYQEAEECFRRAKKIAPNDAVVQKGLKDLAALQTIDKSKWEEQESFRTKVKDIKQAQRLEKETKTAKTEKDIDFLIKETEESIEKESENTSLLFKLAELYREKSDLDKAQVVYRKILKLKPDNEIAKKNIEDLKIKKTDKEIARLEEQLKENPDNEAIKKRLQELKDKRDDLDFESVKEKVARFPNDAQARRRYGLMLKNRGEINEAINQLQQSVKEPSQRLSSLNILGLCFMEKQMYDLAVTQFKKALSGDHEITDETKEIIYNLGTAYEKMQKSEEAINEFKKIYEVDINYKDVARKIEGAY
jgi:tetratricopeptide (TPR) repeat protein